MPPTKLLTDDYVASLLAKDAKASTAKYSSYGLNALLTKRPTTNAPKPNTRFLKNIIKETDNHNATLRAKEREEARARLRRLHTGKESEREPNRHDEDYGRLKRRRLDSDVEEDSDVRRRHGKSGSHKSRDGDRRRHRSSRGERLEESTGEKEESKHSKWRKAKETDNYRRSRKHRNDHYDSTEEEDGHRSHRQRDHHHSHRRYRSKERETQSKKSKHRSPSPSPRHIHHHRSRRRNSYSPKPPLAISHLVNGEDEAPLPSPSSTSSDPLTTLLGPPPPPPAPLPRGRGTTTALDFTSTIDTHFSPTYNPSLDTPPNPSLDHDDWDLALEALRDRQRWKAVGAERLRKAGWGDDVVDAWSKGGKAGSAAEEGDVDSVKWKGRGEGREWDRGKVLTEGGVETAVEWGRLKGT